MSFLNKKEQVIDFQLTPIGKKLLMEGQFKPAEYTFYDSEIIYDGNHCGINEEQNSIQQRILNESLYTQQQSKIPGEISRADNRGVNYSSYIGAPISNNFVDNTEDLPYFEISTDPLIYTIKDTTTKNYEINGSRTIKQIYTNELEVKVIVGLDYEEDLKEQNSVGLTEGENTDMIVVLEPKLNDSSDKTYVALEIPALRIDIEEKNLEESLTNFDLQVFKIKDDRAHALYFESNDIYANVIKDDLLVSAPTPTSAEILPAEEILPFLVSSYFNVYIEDQRAYYNRPYIYGKIKDQSSQIPEDCWVKES